MAEYAEAVYTAVREACGSNAVLVQWEYVASDNPFVMTKISALEATFIGTKTIEEIDGSIAQLRAAVQPLGCQPFLRREKPWTDAEENKVVILHAAGLLDIVEMTGLTSAGVNYDIDDEIMRNTFSDWDKRFGLTILEVSNAYLRLHFDAVPEDENSFLEEIITFCPTLTEVLETMPELRKVVLDLQQTHVLDLWWD